MKRGVLFAIVIGCVFVLLCDYAQSQEKKPPIPQEPASQKRYPPKGTAAQLTDPPGQPAAKPQRALTLEEKAASWPGEKVILLGWSRYEQPPFPLDLLGKTGTVVKVASLSKNGSDLIIRLDGSDKELPPLSIYNIGFLGKMKAAEALVGRTVWAKGPLELYRGESSTRFPPANPFIVKGAEWRTKQNPGPSPWDFGLFLYLESVDGEGGLIISSCLDERLENQNCQPEWLKMADQFFFEDPHKLYPSWRAEVWKLIESETVEAGMTLDMLKVVCGRKLKRVGGQWLEDKQTLVAVYECQSKLIQVGNNGRVLEWKAK